MSIHAETDTNATPPAEDLLATHATIPTWLLRNTGTPWQAKALYLHLSTLYDGTPILVESRRWVTGEFTHVDARKIQDFEDWLEDLSALGIIGVDEVGEHRFLVRFNIYRSEP